MPVSISADKLIKLSACDLSFDLESVNRLIPVVGELKIKCSKGRYHLSFKDNVVHVHPVVVNGVTPIFFKPKGAIDIGIGFGVEWNKDGIDGLIFHKEGLKIDPLKSSPQSAVPGSLLKIAPQLNELRDLSKKEELTAEEKLRMASLVRQIQDAFKDQDTNEVSSLTLRQRREAEIQRAREVQDAINRSASSGASKITRE